MSSKILLYCVCKLTQFSNPQQSWSGFRSAGPLVCCPCMSGAALWPNYFTLVALLCTPVQWLWPFILGKSYGLLSDWLIAWHFLIPTFISISPHRSPLFIVPLFVALPLKEHLHVLCIWNIWSALYLFCWPLHFCFLLPIHKTQPFADSHAPLASSAAVPSEQVVWGIKIIPLRIEWKQKTTGNRSQRSLLHLLFLEPHSSLPEHCYQ